MSSTKTKYLNRIYDSFYRISSLISLNNICECINIVKINTYFFFSRINLSLNNNDKKKDVDLENIYESKTEKIKKKKISSNEYINIYQDNDLIDHEDYCAMNLSYGYKNNNYNLKKNIYKRKIYNKNNNIIVNNNDCDWGWFVIIDDCR